MGSMSLIHWIIVGAVLLLLFGGKNKISDVMGDVAKGIKSFKKGLTEDDERPTPREVEPLRAEPTRTEPMRSLDQYPHETVPRESVAHETVAHETSEPRKVG